MTIESDGMNCFRGWRLDPFDELQRVWKAIGDGAPLGVPHVVGRAIVEDGMVSGLEMSVILHEIETELSFRDGREVYFMIPASQEDGIDGLYMKLDRVLRDAK